ncbi:MAG: hypothetical protein H7Z21_08780 [Hymenobacter sp.]|nr:hypothetical protein [Hymenobacter sp.]
MKTLLLAAFVVLSACAQDSTLTRLLRTNAYPLTASGTQFSGTGWDRVRASVQQSQFVLLGEDHGTAQIPAFTAAVAQVLKPAAFVAEIDKYQAQELTRLSDQPSLATAYFKANPGSLSFYSWAEEFELAQQLRAQKTQLIGVEQVGVFTISRFYTQLAGLVKSKSAGAYLRRRAVAYQAHDLAVSRKGGENYSMVIQKQSAVDSLQVFARQESPEVQRMVQDYAVSYKIYQSSVSGSGGHQERVNLMKRNLLQSLRPYQSAPGQPQPKLLFKFGASHMARTLSPWAGITDVGNLVQNLADVQDAQSLHLLVMGKQGTHVGGFSPDDPSKNVAPYTLVDELYFKPFLDLTTGSSWQVFDLRPARKALLRDKLNISSQKLQNIILGYDYVVIIPETTASRS